EIAEVEVVGDIGADVGGQAGNVIPRLLGTLGKCSRLAQGIAWEETTDVNLTGGSTLQLIIAIAAVEMPLRTEVMVQPNHSKVGSIGKRHVGLESLFVDTVTTRRASKSPAASSCRIRLVRFGHILGP